MNINLSMTFIKILTKILFSVTCLKSNQSEASQLVNKICEELCYAIFTEDD